MYVKFKVVRLKIIAFILLCWSINPTYPDELMGLVNSMPTKPAQNSKSRFVYYFHGESLRQALQTFAKSNNLHVYFATGAASKVFNKTIVGRFSASDSNNLLDILTEKYNFSWFIYAGTLYLTSTQIVNRSVSVSRDEFTTIKTNLTQIGLLNDKFSYAEVPTENRIIVSGPEAYVTLVIKQINNLRILPDKQQYVIYRLKYANSVDTQLSFNNQMITIPGIVTILQGLASGKTGNGGIVSTVNELTKNAGDNNSNNGATKSNSSAPASAKGMAISANASTLPTDNSSIQADPRTNSVIIIGDPTYVTMYKNLIKMLDIPSILVQVDVSIIHLNQTKLDAAGIDWSTVLGGKTAVAVDNMPNRAFGGGGSSFGGMSAPGVSGFGAAGTGFSTAGTTGFGSSIGNVGGVVGGAPRTAAGDIFVTNLGQFNLAIKAFEESNLATVTSKPSLVTENNLPAILSMMNNLYIPLQYGVSNFGQLQNGLQITPYIIFGNGGSKLVRLAIVLNDSSIGDDSVSSMNLMQSTLTSQAVVPEGQSLLLAGFSRDIKAKVNNQVPVLGDIPLLGWFFRSSATVVQNMTTLYMITPKILWMPELYSLKDKSFFVDNHQIDVSNNNAAIIVKPATSSTTAAQN